MGRSNRPGHAVSYRQNLRAIGDAGSKPGSGTMCSATKSHRKAMFYYSGFKRTFLTSGVTPAEVKNGSVGPGRPCCFPVLKLFFSQGLELCSQQRNLTEAMFYSGFKRTFLTSGVTPAEVKNGSVGPARPCCFPVLKLFF